MLFKTHQFSNFKEFVLDSNLNLRANYLITIKLIWSNPAETRRKNNQHHSQVLLKINKARNQVLTSLRSQNKCI